MILGSTPTKGKDRDLRTGRSYFFSENFSFSHFSGRNTSHSFKNNFYRDFILKIIP